MTKATRHPTKTDVLIRTVNDAREARGLNRHRIIPKLIQSPVSGGNNPASGQQVGNSGNFLQPQGDTMVGPIAFFPKVATIDKTDPENPSIDIGSDSEDYSTYIYAGTSSPDEIRTILGASFSGQFLLLQSTDPVGLTLANGSGVLGGNIITGTGADITLGLGEVAELLYDPTAVADPTVHGAWRVISGGAGGGGGVSKLDDLTDVTIVSPIQDQTLVYNATTMLWENQATPSGGMATDLSNMVSPTVPTVPLSMNTQNIDGVNNLDFTGSGGISGVHTIDFFQAENFITDTGTDGLQYYVSSTQKHQFKSPNGNFLVLDEVNPSERRIDMQANRATNIDKLQFSPVSASDTSLISEIYEDTGFNNLRYVSKNSHIFVQEGVPTLFSIGNFNGDGGLVQDIGLLNFNATTLDLTTRDGDFQLVFQSGSSGPADMFVRSGGALKNMSDIGTGGSGNEISQGNTSVTVIDTGSGSITDIVDGTVVSTKSASNFSISQSVTLSTNTLSGLGDTTPAGNHIYLLGGSTLFWSAFYTDRTYFQNSGNFILGSSAGLSHNVALGDTHEFEIGFTPQLTIRTDEIDVENNNIVAINDMVFSGTSSAIDMNGGDINDWDDMTARGSSSILNMNGGDITNVDALTVNGNSQFGGSLIMNGALDHNGTTVGFYGTAPKTRKFVSLPSSTSNNDLFISLSQLINTLKDNSQGYGLIS